MRRITKIIVHCSDTPADRDIGVAEITAWHILRGWSDIGYHYVIRRDGSVEYGRPPEKIGAHTRGHNRDSLGVCLIGGKGGFNFTHKQMEKMVGLIWCLCIQHGITVKDVHGHNEFSSKECPFFDVRSYFDDF